MSLVEEREREREREREGGREGGGEGERGGGGVGGRGEGERGREREQIYNGLYKKNSMKTTAAAHTHYCMKEPVLGGGMECGI